MNTEIKNKAIELIVNTEADLWKYLNCSKFDTVCNIINFEFDCWDDTTATDVDEIIAAVDKKIAERKAA